MRRLSDVTSRGSPPMSGLGCEPVLGCEDACSL